MKVFTRIAFCVTALVLALLCVVAFPTEANAATEGYYTYEVSNGEATITGCDTSISGDITIPATLGGYPVTGIRYYAFSACEDLTGIVIPNGVTYIGPEAFSYCPNLVSIKIPNGVTNIGHYMFAECKSLTSIEIPNSVTSLGQCVFYGCESLTSIHIPESVTSIGERAFDECKSLTSIHIPESVTSLGQGVFCGCESLTSITVHADNAYYASADGVLFNKDKTLLICYPACKAEVAYKIPDGVTSIAEDAFEGCNNLASIEIPGSVTDISDHEFNFCKSLSSITVHTDNSHYASDSGVLFNKDKTLLICYPICKAGATYKIPDGVTSIGNFAFSYCESLTGIEIPNSVTSIGDSAFSYCESLTSVEIPNSVTSIGEFAFNMCEGLTGIEIPNSVTSIGDWAFQGCKSLTTLHITNSVTSTCGGTAFWCCYSLETVIYCGTQEQWDNTIGKYESVELNNATLQFHNYQSGTCTICGETGGPIVIEKLKAPTLSKSGEILSWNAVNNATGYEIYRATSKSGKYTKVATVTETAWQDEGAADGKTYYYKVKAIYSPDTTKNSGYSSVVSVDYKCDAPEITVVNDSSGKPVISWAKVTGAKKYEIWRSVDGGVFKKLTTTTKLTYTDSKATAGAECTYKVKALGSKSSYNGEFSETGSCYVTLAAPSLTLKSDKKTGKPALSWKKVTGAKSYAIYRSENGGEYQLLTTTTSVSCKDTAAQQDNKYSYYVVTVGKSEIFNSAPSAVKSTTLGVKAPKLTGSTDANGSPVITWAAVENAVSYEIYRSTKSSKGYSLLATVETTSYTDATVATGKTYYYKVIAVGTNTESAMSSYLKMVGKCAAPELFVETAESGKPCLKWYKVTGAKKYTVYRATSENGKYKKLGTTTKIEYIDTKAAPGTVYFYKIVANASSSKCNSSYSNIVSCGTYCGVPAVKYSNNSAGAPVLNWSKVTGAAKYKVMYMDVTDYVGSVMGPDFENDHQVAYTTKTTFTLPETEPGRMYMVSVVAVAAKEEYSSQPSETKIVDATCATPKVTGKVGANKKPVVSWNEVEGAAQYIVLRSTSKSKGYQIVGEIEAGTSFEDLTAKKGKTYYYKVVAVGYDGSESAESAYVKVKSK